MQAESPRERKQTALASSKRAKGVAITATNLKKDALQNKNPAENVERQDILAKCVEAPNKMSTR